MAEDFFKRNDYAELDVCIKNEVASQLKKMRLRFEDTTFNNAITDGASVNFKKNGAGRVSVAFCFKTDGAACEVALYLNQARLCGVKQAATTTVSDAVFLFKSANLPDGQHSLTVKTTTAGNVKVFDAQVVLTGDGLSDLFKPFCVRCLNAGENDYKFLAKKRNNYFLSNDVTAENGVGVNFEQGVFNVRPFYLDGTLYFLCIDGGRCKILKRLDYASEEVLDVGYAECCAFAPTSNGCGFLLYAAEGKLYYVKVEGLNSNATASTPYRLFVEGFFGRISKIWAEIKNEQLYFAVFCPCKTAAAHTEIDIDGEITATSIGATKTINAADVIFKNDGVVVADFDGELLLSRTIASDGGATTIKKVCFCDGGVCLFEGGIVAYDDGKYIILKE